MVIYCAKNILTGKLYIGQTNNLKRRMIEHKNHAIKDGGPFHNDILEYGFHSFDFYVLQECSAEESDELERKYIADFRSKYGSDMIYNYCDGGKGGKTHDITGINNPMYGVNVSDDVKLRISKKLKGVPKPDGFGQKISMKLKGVPKSPEAVAKKSHPITIQNVNTSEIFHMPSKSAADRFIGHKSATAYMLKYGNVQHGYRVINDEKV